MDNLLTEDQTFENIDYTERLLPKAEYSNCKFINCNFAKSDLGQIDFIDCNFSGCNLSMALLTNTGLKTVHFLNCKLTGLDFSACNNFLFSASFEHCHLDYASFYQKKMKKASFVDCHIKEVDFVETDLSGALFKNCDLQDTVFNRTILEKADLRTAYNYVFDPEVNKIKKARFSFPHVAGLLAKYQLDIS